MNNYKRRKFSSLSLENLGNCIYNMQTYKEK